MTRPRHSYNERPPQRPLARHVRCLWGIDADGSPETSHPVLPDGCIDLLFEQDRRGTRLKVIGTMSRTLWAPSCEPCAFVGVRLEPGAAYPLLKLRADALTDESAEAEAFWGREARQLRERLGSTPSRQERQALLEAFVGDLVQQADPPDARVALGARALSADPALRIDHLADELTLSRQHARRLFLQHTGLTPKVFARVARLSRLIATLGGTLSLADAALAAGYADQAHMTSEFRSLVGVSPSVYRARHLG